MLFYNARGAHWSDGILMQLHRVDATLPSIAGRKEFIVDSQTIGDERAQEILGSEGRLHRQFGHLLQVARQSKNPLSLHDGIRRALTNAEADSQSNESAHLRLCEITSWFSRSGFPRVAPPSPRSFMISNNEMKRRASLTIPQAIEISSHTIGNYVYRDILHDSAQSVRNRAV